MVDTAEKLWTATAGDWWERKPLILGNLAFEDKSSDGGPEKEKTIPDNWVFGSRSYAYNIICLTVTSGHSVRHDTHKTRSAQTQLYRPKLRKRSRFAW